MRKKLFSFLTIAVLLFTSCSSNEEPTQNSLTEQRKAEITNQSYYFTSSIENNVLEYTLRQIDDQEFTISTSKITDDSRSVIVEIDPFALDEFNKKNNTNYQVLPEDNYVTTYPELYIPANSNISNPFHINITSIDNLEKDVTYCMPLTIMSTSDDAKLNTEHKTIYVVIKPEQTCAATFEEGVYYNVPFLNDETLSNLKQCSFETFIRVNEIDEDDFKISTIMGIEENFLLRLGDIFIYNNQLQLSIKGGIKVTSDTRLNKGQWYHIAAVYDGSKAKLYIDGKLDKEANVDIEPVDLTARFYSTGFQISQDYDSESRFMNASIREMRVWRKALTQYEIRSNSSFLPREEYNGLIAYWPFNDKKDIVKDHSGNGFDIKVSKKEVDDDTINSESNFQKWEVIN